MNDGLRVTPAAVLAAANGDLENMLAAMTPGGIERQEAQGQAKFVASETLPIECKNVSRDAMIALGFVFGPPVDDLFVSCTLPPGWTKRATEHAMWSELLDAQGRTRASMFYKAAFYDRAAFMRFDSRYRLESYAEGSTDDMRACLVRDGNTVLKLFGERASRDYEVGEKLEAEGLAWITERFPNWRDPLAYWEEA